ncbi:MAG: hypothetical protein ABSE73_19000 [Planctomycetota bacterium]
MDLTDPTMRIATRHEVDVIALIEVGDGRDRLNSELCSQQKVYHLAEGPLPEDESEFMVFTRFPSEFMPLVHSEQRMILRRVQLAGKLEILFVLVHLMPKAYQSEAEREQSFETPLHSAKIAEIEGGDEHPKTIVVGDFNMNPFEPSMVAGVGFNAVMTRRIAESKKEQREVCGPKYRYFYNPMWGRFGDTTAGPGGTYFFDHSGHHINYYWNIFDQVLLRPALLPYFDHKDLDIVTHDGQNSLLTSAGRPDADSASDHLPLLFKLSL